MRALFRPTMNWSGYSTAPAEAGLKPPRKGAFWIRVVLTGTVIVMALQLLGVLSWMGTLLAQPK